MRLTKKPFKLYTAIAATLSWPPATPTRFPSLLRTASPWGCVESIFTQHYCHTDEADGLCRGWSSSTH